MSRDRRRRGPRSRNPDRRERLLPILLLVAFGDALIGVVANVAAAQPLPALLAWATSGVGVWILLAVLLVLQSLLIWLRNPNVRLPFAWKPPAVLDRLRPVIGPPLMVVSVLLTQHVTRGLLQDLGLGPLATFLLSSVLVLALASLGWPIGQRLTGRTLTRPEKASGLTSSVTLLAIVVGLIVWQLQVPEPDHCGSAVIAVDNESLQQPLLHLQPLLQAYEQQVASGHRRLDGRTIGCAGALHLDNLGANLHDNLKWPSTIAAVITADPASIHGLNGTWDNLEANAAERGKWRILGLNPSRVLPSRPTEGKTVRLQVLEYHGAMISSDADATTLSVWNALGGFTSATTIEQADPVALKARLCGQRRPPRDLILAGTWELNCPPTAAEPPITITDSDGNTIGAAVLGIPLAGSPDAEEGPTSQARAAAEDFLSWLESQHTRLGLERLNRPLTWVLKSEEKLNGLSQSQSGRQPLHITVVLDGSLSMGRPPRSADYGTPSPWRSARNALVSWLDRTPLTSQDSSCVIVARQRGAGRQPDAGDCLSRAQLASPGQVPQRETALPAALRAASRSQAAHPGLRPVTVLLTDGVNVFTENGRLRSDRLGQVDVIMIGGHCTGVRPAPRSCHTVAPSASSVAEQLTAMTRNR